MLLTNASSEVSSTIDNPSPILTYVVQFPFVFSLHKDETLQYFSVPTREVGTVNLKSIRSSAEEDELHDLPSPSNHRPPGLSEIDEDGSMIDIVPLGNTGYRSTALLATPDNEVAVVRTHDHHYSVYQFTYQPEVVGLIFQRKGKLEPQTDAEDAVESNRGSTHVKPLKLVEACSKLWNHHLILGNHQVKSANGVI